MAKHVLEDQAGSVTEAFSWVQVPHEHHWHAMLEGEAAGWQSRGIQRVDVFHVVPVGISVIVQTILAVEVYDLTRQLINQ